MVTRVLTQGWLWALLAVPAALTLFQFASGQTEAAELLSPTGVFSARLMIFAMMIGPLKDAIGPRVWIIWLMRRRRHFGVAAFLYALLHLVFYGNDMEWTPALMLDEIGVPGIWTGWLALLVMLIPALASNDAAMRTLRQAWKKVQQLVYLAAIFTVAHWLFVTHEPIMAIVHFTPLLILNIIGYLKIGQRRFQP
jgi:methionine sulfoxide reductase heme-binding subunit